MAPKNEEGASAEEIWTIPGFEASDEYAQEMTPDELQSLAVKLAGYGEPDQPVRKE